MCLNFFQFKCFPIRQINSEKNYKGAYYGFEEKGTECDKKWYFSGEGKKQKRSIY